MKGTVSSKGWRNSIHSRTVSYCARWLPVLCQSGFKGLWEPQRPNDLGTHRCAVRIKDKVLSRRAEAFAGDGCTKPSGHVGTSEICISAPTNLSVHHGHGLQ
jgi:hypothetical protein